MGVTFKNMIEKSMRLYWNNTEEFDELSSNKSRKYSKKYFDSIADENLSNKNQKPDKEKEFKEKKDKY